MSTDFVLLFSLIALVFLMLALDVFLLAKKVFTRVIFLNFDTADSKCICFVTDGCSKSRNSVSQKSSQLYHCIEQSFTCLELETDKLNIFSKIKITTVK